MIRFYECPAEEIEEFGTTTYRPLLTQAVSDLGGEIQPIDQDSDTDPPPSSFIVGVAGGPEVHAAIAGKVAGARHLGSNFDQAQNAVRSHPAMGPIRANRMRNPKFLSE